MVDIDFNIYATDAFTIGGEGIYRQNQAASSTLVANNSATKIFGGILDLNYAFSDVWDGTLKYTILCTNNGNGTADANFVTGVNTAALSSSAGLPGALGVAKGYLQEISVAGGYQITDGAKLKAEYRLDWTKYSTFAGTSFNKNLTSTVLAMFEYAF